MKRILFTTVFLGAVCPIATAQTVTFTKDVAPILQRACQNCHRLGSIAPMLDDLAKEYSGRLKVVKINIDENQKTPMTYGIRGIPTLMVFKGGKVEATQIGAVGKGQLTQMVDKVIAQGQASASA